MKLYLNYGVLTSLSSHVTNCSPVPSVGRRQSAFQGEHLLAAIWQSCPGPLCGWADSCSE
jgi:hypothetical protein